MEGVVVMTDLEIIGKMKDDIIKGNTADFLTLDVFDTDTNERHCFSEQFFDDMLESLFKWSLSKTIVNFRHNGGNYPEYIGNRLLSFNGSPCPVIGYTFVIRESKDFQTNITPKLLKFLEVVLSRSGLSRLAFPAGRGDRVDVVWDCVGFPIVNIQTDPWVEFEEYLNS